ncbi:MAG: glycine zipper 2TM domain-containing protein [Candidatus Omnitrophica bacterium]|nr:glycine zipper 2TM domain-containing protein [Candidatus Omnitrophota bacterium]
MRNKETFALLTLLAVAVAVSGCARATPTQKGAVVGSAVGAGLGAIIGHQSGETGKGALIGAAAGGLAGALLGDAMASKFCSVCGRNYLSGDTYCTLHNPPVALSLKGAPAQTAEEQKAQTVLPKFCPTCGDSYPESAEFCGKDGATLKLKKT